VPGYGTSGDCADGRTEDHIAKIMHILVKSRDGDVTGHTVTEKRPANTGVTFDDGGNSESGCCMTGWKSVTTTMVGPLAPDRVFQTLHDDLGFDDGAEGVQPDM